MGITIWCIDLIETRRVWCWSPGVWKVCVAAVPSLPPGESTSSTKPRWLGSSKVEVELIRVWLAWIAPPRYGDHPKGRPSTTLWRVRARQPNSTQLWLRPLTGRSHQLRAHLAGIGHPIVGDPIYGEALTTPMRLHARALGFEHPFTGLRLRVSTRQEDVPHTS